MSDEKAKKKIPTSSPNDLLKHNRTKKYPKPKKKIIPEDLKKKPK